MNRPFFAALFFISFSLPNLTALSTDSLHLIHLNGSSGLSLSFGLNHAVEYVGGSISVTNPWLLDRAAVSAGEFVLFRKDEYLPYYGLKLGLAGGSFMATSLIRLYGGRRVDGLAP